MLQRAQVREKTHTYALCHARSCAGTMACLRMRLRATARDSIASTCAARQSTRQQYIYSERVRPRTLEHGRRPLPTAPCQAHSCGLAPGGVTSHGGAAKSVLRWCRPRGPCAPPFGSLTRKGQRCKKFTHVRPSLCHMRVRASTSLGGSGSLLTVPCNTRSCAGTAACISIPNRPQHRHRILWAVQ